jgi:hypothetical protein
MRLKMVNNIQIKCMIADFQTRLLSCFLTLSNRVIMPVIISINPITTENKYRFNVEKSFLFIRGR